MKKDPLCQALKAHQEGIERGEMKQRKLRNPSTWHEEVYHATPRCQAASLSLTSRRLHGQDLECLVERQKTGCCFASAGYDPGAPLVAVQLQQLLDMVLLCSFKAAGLSSLL